MPEATSTTTTSKAKAKPSTPMFDTPAFEFPKFEMPKFDVPATFREFAEKGAAQAKENYDKIKAAAEESTAVLEDTYTTAAKGLTAYNLKFIEAARANANAAFDFISALVAAKSPSEAVELSSTHARKQFDACSEQAKELSKLAQKVAVDTAEPIKTSVSNAFGKVA